MVRCPLCREQYRLEEALDQLPPELMLVDGGYDDDEGELVGAGVGASDYQVAGEYGGSSSFDRGMGSADSVFSTGGPGGTALADTGVAAPTPRLTGAARPKRKEKSAVAEIIKVVLGGVVGLTAGMLILWWVAGRDPLELGPKVAEYAPWIVPAQFHGKGGPAKPDANSTADTSGSNTIAANPNPTPNSNPPAPTPNTGNGFNPPGVDLEAATKNFNPNDPSNPPAGNGGAFSAPNDPLASNDPLTDPGADPAGLTIDPLPALDGDKPEMPAEGNDPLSSLDTPPDLSPAADPPAPPATETTEPPAADPASPPATDPANTTPVPDPFAPTTPAPMPEPPATESPANEPPQPAEEVAASAAEIEEAVGQATAAREAFDNSKGQPPAERQQLAIEMYAQAAEAGPLLAGAPTDNADYAATVEKANAELTALGAPSRHNALNFLTTKRLDTPDEGEGVLLVGTVKDFKSVGSLYETTFELAGRDPRIVFVVTEANPQDQFKVGDKAAIVGRIVRDVKKDLPKYGGEQNLVVEQGHAVALPAQ